MGHRRQSMLIVVILAMMPSFGFGYWRGSGYAWHFFEWSNDGMLSRCRSDNHPGGCEMNGALAYPICAPFHHAVGCCVCEPEPYGRGAGQSDYHSCLSQTAPQYGVGGCDYAAGLYYPQCKQDFTSSGCCICSPPCDRSAYPECGNA